MAEALPAGSFESAFFLDEVNRFVGSGGEILVKGSRSSDRTRIEVGDRLVGIGVTHLVETLDRPPGLDSFRSFDVASVPSKKKAALRAFEVAGRERTAAGFAFRFAPLDPTQYSALVEEVSEGAVSIPADTIPEGTMVISFLAAEPTYTLRTVDRSPGANWLAATEGARQWNVGVGDPSDFWAASFPSDDIGPLTRVPPSASFGTIRFGLSLLPGSETAGVSFERVPHPMPVDGASRHHFCLLGEAVGTAGLDTPFPIGLRTKITFKPVGKAARARKA